MTSAKLKPHLPRSKIEYVYIGRYLRGATLTYVYAPLTSDGHIDKALAFAEPLGRDRVGDIVRYSVTSEGVDRSEPGERVGRWKDESLITAWEAEDAAEAQRALANDDPPTNLVTALEPVRRAYLESDEDKRAQMLAWVVRCIVGDE